jgi:Stage II sporulation protein E (SpoIIE)
MCFATLASERPLSGGEILLQKIPGDGCQRLVVARFGIAARTGIGPKRVRFRSECFRKERCELLTQQSAIHSGIFMKWAATSWIFSHCRMERLESIWATSRARASGGIMRSAGCGDLARGSQDRRPTEAMAGLALLSARGNRELDLRGIPPGMVPETKYDSETVQLDRGDSVIFPSDGFCLVQRSEGEFFGMESVLEENSPQEALQQLAEAVVSYSCGRPQQDDRTAAILRYIPGNSG